ncbi:delta-lactam-biosynthetic de-N-acetylase [Sporolactobacillus sp. STSJ-5]|uniref:delta-lactam-biosynthetic de-N-acetylase n=1 Tax=Sporolactobacillus sp. STSJ-5 TaxID=2965076 RepID=UPI00351D6CFD
MKKIVLVLLIAMCGTFVHPFSSYGKDWYFKPAKNNQPATTEPEYEALLKKYDGIFIGDTSKKELYLTFDNGYEAGYTSGMLDTLKKEKVPATFFITGHYISDQPELVKRMVKEGHIVGNHSWSHPDLSKISDAKYKKELAKLKGRYMKLTGDKQMTYLRPPRGTFSERSLKLGHDAGYTNVFWSAAYRDWLRDDQHGADYAYDHIMKRIHPGAVILLHTVSKDNAQALPRVIHDLKKQGYQFRSLDDLMAKRVLPSEFW